MSEMAKKAREAMKNKAKRLGTTDPHQKVDASSWTPPEPLDTEVKTGLRPVSRRAYKKGGKVEGMAAKMHAGRKPRKSGGEATAYANAKINRNVKDANEEREGKKHIGGLKKGGRACKEEGGGLYEGDKRVVSPTATRAAPESNLPKNPPLPPARPKDLDKDQGMTAKEAEDFMKSRKAGGRAKKMDGGPMMPPGAMPQDPRLGIVKPKAMNFTNNPVIPGQKKGGKVEKHPDEAMDKALIKKMVKKEARTGKSHGGMKRMNRMHGGASVSDAARRGKFNSPAESMNDTENKYRETLEDISHLRSAEDESSYRGRKNGGKALDGELQGTRPTGGRLARKNGGRAKGKTNINIIISAGEKGGPGGMNPMGKPAIPPGPGPMPQMPPMPPGGPAAPPPAMPMGGMPGAPMPNMPPMPRKSGGRITFKAKSFEDMKAGAGSGEGRLQKADIAEYKRGKHRAGGKVYRSYKDMDAGAGSGLGRLEKSEIQARKH